MIATVPRAFLSASSLPTRRRTGLVRSPHPCCFSLRRRRQSGLARAGGWAIHRRSETGRQPLSLERVVGMARPHPSRGSGRTRGSRERRLAPPLGAPEPAGEVAVAAGVEAGGGR